MKSRKFLNEAPTSSASLLGGKDIKIPRDGSHKGQRGWQSGNAWDIKASIGDPVYAIAAGRVKTYNDYGPKIKRVENKKLFGIGFTVESDDGKPDVYYTHLKDSQVRKGDKVKCGQLLGYVMDFPGSSFDHVHIGVEEGRNIREFLTDDGKIKCSPSTPIDTKKVGTMDKGILAQLKDFVKDLFGIDESVAEENKNIFKLFETIEEKKSEFTEGLKMTKLSSTSYSNLKFDNDGTQNDEVNQTLLDDIDKAAKAAGLTATITTAKTGHGKYTKGGKNISRHMSGTAVDIAILNGKGSGGATNSTNGKAEFRELGNKLCKELEKMGYTRNKEVGQNKAVLWHTNIGGNHYNHLHVSNKTGVPSNIKIDDIETTGEPDSTETSKDTESSLKNFDLKGLGDVISNFMKSIFGSLGINESLADDLGVDVVFNKFNAVIKIKRKIEILSPLSGKIRNNIRTINCSNRTFLQVEVNKRGYYLEYCGMEKSFVKDGDSVKKGQPIGESSKDVNVTFYDQFLNRIPFEKFDEEEDYKETKNSKVKEPKKEFEPEMENKPLKQQTPKTSKFGFLGTMFGDWMSPSTKKSKPFSKKPDIFGLDKKSNSSKNYRDEDIFNMKARTGAKNLLKTIKNPKKVNENIERIKKLL